MTDTDFVTVTITGPSTEQLAKLVRLLVEARLAACGNIIPGVVSIYRWRDAIEREPEALALVHTRARLFRQIENLVTQLHPYETPQVTAIPISAINETYSNWLRDNTQLPG
ncbi:divalent-cation tolerance protein CutA [Luteococcus sediminum]